MVVVVVAAGLALVFERDQTTLATEAVLLIVRLPLSAHLWAHRLPFLRTTSSSKCSSPLPQ